MNVNDIQTALWRCRKGLILLISFAVMLCHFYLQSSQAHSATVYIRFLGNQAESGIAADGSELNPYEISNPYVVGEALKQLGVTQQKASTIAQDISVTPILSNAEKEKYASWIDQFSSYEESEENKIHATFFCVQFKTEEGDAFARDFLSALVQQYRLYYTKTYAGTVSLVMITEDNFLNADYFDASQRLQTQIESNIDYLATITASDTDYRSPKTGFAISDLIDAHKLLLETRLSSVSRYITDLGVSRDSGTLIASLQSRIDQAQMESDKNAAKATTQDELMSLYVEKNYEYLWNVTGEDSDSQIREEVERDEHYREIKTTYDQMMLDYVRYAVKSRDLLVDKAYEEFYLSKFTAVSTASTALEEELMEIYQDYAELHTVTEQTLVDYNNFRSAQHISQVSGIQTEETLPDLLYYAVSAIFACCLGVACIILLEYRRRGVDD